MAPRPAPENLAPPENGRERHRASLEFLNGLLDLTVNELTVLDEVGGREIRPAASLRRLLKSLSLFPPPQKGSQRFRVAVMKKREEIIGEIAHNAASIARRLDQEHSTPAAVLRDLWQRVASLPTASTEVDLWGLSGGLRAAVSGALRSCVGYRDPLKFRDDILVLEVGAEAERTSVLKRWADQLERTWSPKSRRIRRILGQHDEPATLKRNALYVGLWQAVTDGDRLQRVRLGTEWVKDHALSRTQPKPLRVRPAEYLGAEDYWLWLRRRAIATAEEYMLGVPDDAFVVAAWEFERDLRRATRRPHEDMGVALAGFLGDANVRTREQSVEEVEDPRRDRLEDFLARATPDERALLAACERHPKVLNAPSHELAKDVGKTPAAVRKLKERLLRRARQI